MSAVLLDTGVLVALLDRDDPHHSEVRYLFDQPSGTFLVPSFILPEVCYMAQKYLGSRAELSFLKTLLDGELAVEWGQPLDLRRAAHILERRPELGFVDAAVIAVAERLKIRQIATLDRRHFGNFKPAHCQAFEILP